MAINQAIGFDTDLLLNRFNDTFGADERPVHQYFAPGRVNLIGDHTDYTGGYVFPCAINRGSLLIIRPNNNSRFRFASTNFEFQADLSADEIGQTHGDDWINYPLGVIDQFKKRGIAITGVDCLFSGNIPNGAGLSSSASIEVVAAFALNELFDCKLSMIELVKMAQAAENDFVGMQCGIMDQFAVALAQENHALFLHCDTLDYRQVPLTLNDVSIVIANTNQRRELNDSAYNERVAECQRALSLLKANLDVNSLGEVSINELETNKGVFELDNVAYQRAHHVISENARVQSAVSILEQGQLDKFGKLMNASHDSLRDWYQVSSDPLNQLVNLARDHAGVIGSRLTGGGFGGCTVNLVMSNQVDQFMDIVGTSYQTKTGLSADFYKISPSNGVRQILS